MYGVTKKDLTYAAFNRCKCGAGFAYIESFNDSLSKQAHSLFDHAWFCSAVMLGSDQEYKAKKEAGMFGGGIVVGEDGIEHDQALAFAFFEIKSEGQPSANGATTRPND
ncbi:hypothetical protein D3C85_1340830 [compost metagenome]